MRAGGSDCVGCCAEAPWNDLTRKNLAQDPGALTRDVMPGYGDVAHSRRHTHAREKEKCNKEPGWARTHARVVSCITMQSAADNGNGMKYILACTVPGNKGQKHDVLLLFKQNRLGYFIFVLLLLYCKIFH